MMNPSPTYLTQTLISDALNLAIGKAAQTPALDPQRLLQAVNQLAPSVAVGSWVALGLEGYFGGGAADLRFKEMLLPFIWVARQQLIARVGAAYQRVAMATRSSLEGELLATLNALCVQGLRSHHHDLSLLQQRDLGDDYCRRGWLVFGRAYPRLALDLAETLAAWVGSMVRQLDDSVGWPYPTAAAVNPAAAPSTAAAAALYCYAAAAGHHWERNLSNPWGCHQETRSPICA
ncbi:MAG TPA: hypothetical protein V6D06_00455 [Trichocoleus sp.]